MLISLYLYKFEQFAEVVRKQFAVVPESEIKNAHCAYRWYKKSSIDTDLFDESTFLNIVLNIKICKREKSIDIKNCGAPTLAYNSYHKAAMARTLMERI